jgi:endogenous inhibitor of DNA gyrase (YacG/DUF329 family)
MPVERDKARKVHCPQCNTAIVWSTDNPFRPFCSERCKLIDLGQWATGAYRIPQVERDIGDSGQPEDEEP